MNIHSYPIKLGKTFLALKSNTSCKLKQIDFTTTSTQITPSQGIVTVNKSSAAAISVVKGDNLLSDDCLNLKGVERPLGNTSSQFTLVFNAEEKCFYLELLQSIIRAHPIPLLTDIAALDHNPSSTSSEYIPSDNTFNATPAVEDVFVAPTGKRKLLSSITPRAKRTRTTSSTKSKPGRKPAAKPKYESFDTTPQVDAGNDDDLWDDTDGSTDGSSRQVSKPVAPAVKKASSSTTTSSTSTSTSTLIPVKEAPSWIEEPAATEELPPMEWKVLEAVPLQPKDTSFDADDLFDDLEDTEEPNTQTTASYPVDNSSDHDDILWD